LHGLWVHFMSAGRHGVAMSWAKKMAAVAAAAESKNVKRDLQIVACRAKMTSLFWMGDLTAAAREAARIESEYSVAAHGHIVEKTNTDPLTAEGIYRSQILWMLGFPDQAIVKSDAKDNHARSRQHPHPIDLGLANLTETGHGAWVPYVRALLGEALARSGDLAGGLACIEQSLEQIERQEERVHLSEVLRLKGWMRMQQGRWEEAEACLREAIGVARRQKAKSWELRAATTLARVLRDRGDRAGAYQLLRPAYDWFKEGFGTKDLKDAKALLAELES